MSAIASALMKPRRLTALILGSLALIATGRLIQPKGGPREV